MAGFVAMRHADAAETRFTVHDYERLPDDLRCQLIEGSLVKEPSPTFGHQRLVSRLLHLLATRIGPERVVPAPIDVVLNDFNVLQPDVAVWAEAPGGDVRRVPTPTVVVEVLSPTTARRDREQKTRLYLAAGVPAVWLIDPATATIEVHTPGGVTRHAADETATSAAIPEFSTSVRDLTR